MGENFLIIANPRSGTYYMAEMLRALGYAVNREENKQPQAVGTVSWYGVPDKKKYNTIAYQLRHPLRVLESPLHKEGMDRYAQTIDFHNGSRLHQRMECWVKWDKLCNDAADFHYKIEDFDSIYPIVMRKLGLDIPYLLPKLPKNLNHRDGGDKYLPKHRNLTWNDLFDEDKLLARLIKRKAEDYGY